MDTIATFTQRNPSSIAREVGHRLRTFRLAKGWTQEELASRAGVSLSTLKMLESKGQASFSRLIRVALILGVEGELRELFSQPLVMESIEAVKRSERQRAPRRHREKSTSEVKAPPLFITEKGLTHGS